MKDCAGFEENTSYPEELTIEEIDKLSSEIFDDVDEAKEYFQEHGGQIYTQVDGEGDRVLYTRGVHIVNRTGIYAVVKSEPPRCPDCGTPLYKVWETDYSTYTFDPKTGTYPHHMADGEITMKCPECEADLYDVFPEGVCNYSPSFSGCRVWLYMWLWIQTTDGCSMETLRRLMRLLGRLKNLATSTQKPPYTPMK